MDVNRRKLLIGGSALVGALLLLSAAYTYTQEGPTTEYGDQMSPEIPVANQNQPVNDTNGTSGGVPTAPVDSDSIPNSATGTTVIIQGDPIASRSDAKLTSARADEILSSFSKKDQSCREKIQEAQTANMKKPNLSPPSMFFGGGRNVLPHGGAPMTIKEGAEMAQVGSMPLFSPSPSGGIPMQGGITINGIICEKGSCVALTNKGQIREGQSVDSENIKSISKSGIQTSKRFIAY